jgi:hypothetical protein
LDDATASKQFTKMHASRGGQGILNKEVIGEWDEKLCGNERFTNVHLLSHEEEDSSGWTEMEPIEKYIPDPSVGDIS